MIQKLKNIQKKKVNRKNKYFEKQYGGRQKIAFDLKENKKNRLGFIQVPKINKMFRRSSEKSNKQLTGSFFSKANKLQKCLK